MSSYWKVPLAEQIEAYCNGLPKEMRDYCMKSKVTNMVQLIETAGTAYVMMKDKIDGSKGGLKIEPKRP